MWQLVCERVARGCPEQNAMSDVSHQARCRSLVLRPDSSAGNTRKSQTGMHYERWLFWADRRCQTEEENREHACN